LIHLSKVVGVGQDQDVFPFPVLRKGSNSVQMGSCALIHLSKVVGIGQDQDVFPFLFFIKSKFVQTGSCALIHLSKVVEFWPGRSLTVLSLMKFVYAANFLGRCIFILFSSAGPLISFAFRLRGRLLLWLELFSREGDVVSVYIKPSRCYFN